MRSISSSTSEPLIHVVASGWEDAALSSEFVMNSSPSRIPSATIASRAASSSSSSSSLYAQRMASES